MPLSTSRRANFAGAPPLLGSGTSGLSAKQVRVATECLHKEGVIVIDPKGQDQTRGRALLYLVPDWAEQQDPKRAKNYFKLFRNLLDEKRRDLLGDPEMFRLWLYLL